MATRTGIGRVILGFSQLKGPSTVGQPEWVAFKNAAARFPILRSDAPDTSPHEPHLLSSGAFGGNIRTHAAVAQEVAATERN